MASAVPPLEEFDPTSETCYDNPVNSCDPEAGQYMAPYARDPTTNHYKLHISDLPLELDEDGLGDIFKRYGKPLGTLIVHVKGYAFVSFATIREAQLAIQKLNNQPPLYMKVRFSKNNERPPQNQFQHPIPRPAHNAYIPSADHFNLEETHTPRPTFPNMGRGRELSNLALSGLGPRRPCSYDNKADVLYPAIRDPTYFDAYEDEGPHYETNTMFARRSHYVISNGSRYVSMGRGYTWFELPPQNPNINEQIKSVYEKRRSCLYEYGENKLSDQIGKCTNCAKPATHRCKQCRVNFYCSRECQTMDWTRHKYDCVPMPELEAAENLSSMSLSSNEEQVQPTSQLEKPAQLRRPLRNQSPIRRSVNPTPHPTLPQKSAADFNSAVPHKNCDNSLEEPQVSKMDGPKIDQIVSKNDPDLQKTDVRINRPYQNNTTPTTDQNRDSKAGPATPIQNRLDNARHPQQRYKSSSPIEDRQTNQHKQPDFRGPRSHKFNNSRLNHIPNQNGTNGCRDETKSNEAIPRTENQPTRNGGNDKKQENDKSQVNHVRNQGRMSNCNDKAAARSTTQLQDPQLDFQLPKLPKDTLETKLPNRSSTPDPLGPMTTSSKRTETPTDAIVHTTSDPVSVVESLVVDDVGCFEVHVPLGNNKFAITICTRKICKAYEQIMTNLTLHCEKLPKDPNFKPDVGNLICGKRENHWIRGNVMSVGPPVQISVIDEGRIEAVDDIRAIPQEYMNLPILGATCEVISEELKLQRMQRYEFCIVRIPNPDKKCVEAYVKSDDMAGRVLLSSWSPAPEQRRLKFATLTSGTDVLLSSFVHQNLMYVRSLLATDSDNFHRLIQDVTKCALNASPITKPPVDGELVLCKFSQDENFYRGIVRHIADNKFRVTYVDFGNSEETTIDKMRHMPEQLKEYPSAVARISLTGVPNDVPMNADVAAYLALLTGTEEPLTCSFDGATLRDGVTLKTSEGINVNKKLIELFTPTWKKDEPEDKTVYIFEMLEIAELGPLNTLIKVIPLAKQSDDLYIMAPQDPELCLHIQGAMSEQIQEYCAQTKEHYIPRENELCLAPFEGVWYRAVCLKPNVTSSTSQIMFVDYGNTEIVANKDIRVMTKDFMTTKALASICQIQGLTDGSKSGEISPAVIARLEQLVPLMSLVTIKILNKLDLGTYTIELPEVQATLVKDGLIKS